MHVKSGNGKIIVVTQKTKSNSTHIRKCIFNEKSCTSLYNIMPYEVMHKS